MAQNNQAWFVTTGPVHVYWRTTLLQLPATKGIYDPRALLASNAPAFFVGHTENSPEVAFEDQWLPVFTSLGGQSIPDDEVYQGKDAKIILDLQRFDMDQLDAIASAPQFGRSGVVGSEGFLARGSLLASHWRNFELWLEFSFYGSVNATPSLRAGYYFPLCRLAGHYPQKMTRDAKKVRLMIQARPLRIGVTGGFMLFSKSADYFAKLPDPG